MRTWNLYGRRGLAPVVVLLAAACGEPAQQEVERPEAVMTSGASVTLGDVEDLGVMNVAMPAPNLLTAGQVTEAQFAALVDRGFTNFISLRVPTENGAGWEETHDLDAGVSFTRIPVAGAGGLTRENVMALDRILDEAAADNTVLYCGSSNRVGGLLALRAYWLDGADPDEAMALGRAAGLTGLEPAVQELLSAPR